MAEPTDVRTPSDLPSTLAELRASGWRSVPVKHEIRANAAARIRAGIPLFPHVLGYEDTVFPQLENALLAGHDVIFLGERGQAKTRMIRSLVDLLDEWMPVVEGSEINDDPYAPVSAHARALVAEMGEETPIAWVHRSSRFGEKLATPDTAIADLIGEVDPIRVAEGRYLSDELTLHYGLVPRTNRGIFAINAARGGHQLSDELTIHYGLLQRANRGIFAINELPDLAERIQVGLLNVLEERDIQIRGYKIQLPLDLLLVASANPEDYTNRGRLITPLKDRFGSQVRTHYPLDVETEVAIIDQEAEPFSVDGVTVRVPEHMSDIIATISQLARQSPHISQRSGVSVRLSVSNQETMVANAARRALAAGETEVVPRVCDLEALPASTAGKIEIETLEEGRDEQVLDHLVRSAVLTVFRERVRPESLTKIVDSFEGHDPIETGEDVPASAYVELLSDLPALGAPVDQLVGEQASAGVIASAVELVLEGLHLSKRLNKDAVGGRAQYRARG